MIFTIKIDEKNPKSSDFLKLIKSLDKENDFLEIIEELEAEELPQNIIKELDSRYEYVKKNLNNGKSWDEIEKEL